MRGPFCATMYESKVEELETALSHAVRRKARTRGKQVAKDAEVADFRTTYSIFVGLIRGSFRLAGQFKLADQLTLARARRSAASTTPLPPQSPPSQEEPQPATPQPGVPQPAVPQPAVPQPAVPPAAAPAPGEEEPGQPR